MERSTRLGCDRLKWGTPEEIVCKSREDALKSNVYVASAAPMGTGARQIAWQGLSSAVWVRRHGATAPRRQVDTARAARLVTAFTGASGVCRSTSSIQNAPWNC